MQIFQMKSLWYHAKIIPIEFHCIQHANYVWQKFKIPTLKPSLMEIFDSII